MKHSIKQVLLLPLIALSFSYAGASKAMADQWYYFTSTNIIYNPDYNYPFCSGYNCNYPSDSEFSFLFEKSTVIIGSDEDVNNSITIINDVDSSRLDWNDASSSNSEILDSNDIVFNKEAGTIFIDSDNIVRGVDSSVTVNVTALVDGDVANQKSFEIFFKDQVEDKAFITKWVVAAGNTVTMPTRSGYNYDGQINWGDGTGYRNFDSYNDSNLKHTFDTAGTYYVTVIGTFESLGYSSSYSNTIPAQMVAVENLGHVGWKSFARAFNNNQSVTSFTAGDADVSEVTTIEYMFSGADGITTMNVQDLNFSSLTNMHTAFHNMDNITSLDLSGWDITSVTQMSSLFNDAISLTTVDLGGWDFRNVPLVYGVYNDMFTMAYDINNIIYDREVDEELYSAFLNLFASEYTYIDHYGSGGVIDAGNNACSPDNGPCLASRAIIIQKGWSINDATVGGDLTVSDKALISKWTVSAGETVGFSLDKSLMGVIDWGDGNVEAFDALNGLNHTYSEAGTYTVLIDGDIVYNMSRLFNSKTIPSGLDISEWDVSKVQDFTWVFRDSTGLEGMDLSAWRPDSVTSMNGTFSTLHGVTSLNLSGWGMAKLDYADYAFYSMSGVTELNLSGWDFVSLTSKGSMFSGSNDLDTIIYNTPATGDQYRRFLQTLNGGGLRTVSSGTATIEAGSNACAADDADCQVSRYALIAKGWTINDTTPNIVMSDSALKTLWTVSAGETVTFPTSKTYSGTVNWGDGTIEAFTSLKDLSHTFSSAGTYTVYIDGYITRDMDQLFYQKTLPAGFDISQWKTPGVKNMDRMFNYARGIANLNLSGWDVSAMDDSYDMYKMFNYASDLKTLNLSGWDVSNVTNKTDMFAGANALDTVIYNTKVSADKYSLFLKMLNYGKLRAVASGIIEGGSNACAETDADCYGARNDLIDLGWTINDATVGGGSLSNGIETLWTVSAGETITFPWVGMFADLQGNIDWGDDSGIESFTTMENLTHTYANSGTYSILIQGDFQTDMSGAFYQTSIPEGLDWSNWDMSYVSTTMAMFYETTGVTELDLSGWDLSNVNVYMAMFTNTPLDTIVYNIPMTNDQYSAFVEILSSGGLVDKTPGSGLIIKGDNNCPTDDNDVCANYVLDLINKGWMFQRTE